MNKKEIQKKVLQNNKQLALNKFNWDEKCLVFSSEENNLFLDFGQINYSTINAGDFATIKAGDSAMINAGESATIRARDYSTINAGESATIRARDYSTINAGDYSTINTGYYATIKAEKFSVVINRNVFEVIMLNNEQIQICPYAIPGYIKNGKYSITGKPSIIADQILSEIISKKEKNGINIYKVKNYGQEKISYLIENDGIYSHGNTLKEAKEAYKYKISDRDTSAY